jgi:sulfatase modifying factor 1
MRALKVHLCTALTVLVLFPEAVRAIEWPSLANPVKDADRPGKSDAALIIAIEDYAFVEDVQGAGASARDWDLWFEARGVPISRVVVLRDSSAVREEILDQARRLATEVPSDGALWIVYIGHGAPSTDGRDGVLVGADAQQKAASLYARSVARQEILAAVSAGQQREVVLILDACFSGKADGGGALVAGLQPLIPVALEATERVTLLTAGAGDEFAGSLPDAKRPAFSYLLLGALSGWSEADEDADGFISLAEGVGYSRGALRRVVQDRRQTPSILGPSGAMKVARVVQPGPNLRAFGQLVAPPPQEADEPVKRPKTASVDEDPVAREIARLEAAERGKQAEEVRARALEELRAKATSALQVEARAHWEKLTVLVRKNADAARPAVEAFVTRYESANVDVQGQAVAVDVPEVVLAKRSLRSGLATIRWIDLRGGTFEMGANDHDEGPIRAVTVAAFSLSQSEVTQGQYQDCVEAGACTKIDTEDCNRAGGIIRDSNHPVVCVTWNQAKAFAAWAGGRLPSEAEWEYAARGGGKRQKFAWGDQPPDAKRLPSMRAAYGNVGNEAEAPAAVCTQPGGSTEQGVCDMTGNVWEWVEDVYVENFEGAPTDGSPRTIGGTDRVRRGGAWYMESEDLRLTNRDHDPTSARLDSVGFRVAR